MTDGAEVGYPGTREAVSKTGGRDWEDWEGLPADGSAVEGWHNQLVIIR